jgi:hypothetical protein
MQWWCCVFVFGHRQSLANHSMRIQDVYVGTVPIPQFIKLCAAQRSSPPRVGDLPRCSPARCWHEGRRAPTTPQTAATSRPASPLRCAPCARDWAFVWRRSTGTPRSCVRLSRSDETACSPVISRCSYAQPPAPAVPALSAPLFRRSPCSISRIQKPLPYPPNPPPCAQRTAHLWAQPRRL